MGHPDHDRLGLSLHHFSTIIMQLPVVIHDQFNANPIFAINLVVDYLGEVAVPTAIRALATMEHIHVLTEEPERRLSGDFLSAIQVVRKRLETDPLAGLSWSCLTILIDLRNRIEDSPEAQFFGDTFLPAFISRVELARQKLSRSPSSDSFSYFIVRMMGGVVQPLQDMTRDEILDPVRYGPQGRCAALWAIRSGFSDQVRVLLDKRIPVHQLVDLDGRCVFSMAAYHNRPGLLQFLLEYYRVQDLNQLFPSQGGPRRLLQDAYDGNAIDSFRFLLSQGCDFNFPAPEVADDHDKIRALRRHWSGVHKLQFWQAILDVIEDVFDSVEDDILV